MRYAPGSLVKSRGREWVVLPESVEDFLVVRPLGGTMQETAGIHPALETVEPAAFTPPTRSDLGDFVSCKLLRDALRFGFRSSVGPFRSFGRLAMQPRPYQLVPLMMALKLDPIRILIADDVGISKTIEACLIAREMLDRGEVNRLCVLCPPHLAEQWQKELASKFNIHAELVIAGTARRLEKNLATDQSIFDAYPFVVVSMDFIKTERRRYDFIRTCPELVIVDEAHTCAASQEGRGVSHQRHLLLSRLTEDPERHLVLVTATPHSGNEGAFRSLLSLIRPEFDHLPDDLSGEAMAPVRRKLAGHLVQRRRADLRHFLQRETPFPEREDKESQYSLSPPYKALFDKVLRYARETVSDTSGDQLRQRVRWWSALSLLRALASSPAAAAATLRERSRTLEADDVDTIDDMGRKSVLDMSEESGEDYTDITPGSDDDPEPGDKPNRRRLLGYAREADALCGNNDAKLVKAVSELKEILNAGFKPIVFCRFIQTAEYLASELRKRLGTKVEVTCITSRLAPEERSAQIEDLDGDQTIQRVLVCTDCLSEGINLQEKFDAVFHYDLSWNPTRHEQRDGRVDRYGQKKPTVRVLTYYGTDNQIDGIVLDVLLRKHKIIRSRLGVSIPMPVDSDQIMNAIFEGLILRQKADTSPGEQLLLFEEDFKPKKTRLHEEWENIADREKRSRTLFAQETIKFGEVAQELDATERAIGTPADLTSFYAGVLQLSGAAVGIRSGIVEADLSGVRLALRESLDNAKRLKVSFEPTMERGAILLHRTHPMVESLASYVLSSALDPDTSGVARRAGIMRTSAVKIRTVLLLLRLRYHIITRFKREERHLLAEDALISAFTGDPSSPQWLEDTEAENLLQLKPDADVPPDLAGQTLESITQHLPDLSTVLDTMASSRGKQLLEAHRRVREASDAKGSYRIEHSMPDIVGLYVFLPIVRIV